MLSVKPWIFRPILAGVVSRGTYTRFGRTFEDERRVMEKDGFRNYFLSGFLLMYLYPFLVSNAAMVLTETELNGERLQMPSLTILNLDGPPPSRPH